MKLTSDRGPTLDHQLGDPAFRRARSSTASRSPETSCRVGWPCRARPDRVRPEVVREALDRRLAMTPRTVRRGLSALTVAAPTRIASDLARSSMNIGSGRFARDPLAGPVGGRRPTVQGGSQLQHNIRATGPAMGQIGRHLGLHCAPARSDGDVDPGRFKRGNPVLRRPVHRVRNRDHDSSYAGLDDGLGTWRSSAVMRTGLEGDIQRRPLGARSPAAARTSRSA